MQVQPLSASSTPLPRIIAGTASMGSPLPRALTSRSARAAQLDHLDRLFALGCTAIDTAAIYQLGGTERLLGEWLASRKNRDRVFLITKGGHPNPLGKGRLDPSSLRSDLEGSLRRLGTDAIDLYLLHRDDPAQPVTSVLETLAGMQRQGKIRAYGVSNWSHPRIAEAQEIAAQRGWPAIAASSPHFSLAEWTSPPWSGCVSIAGESGRSARDFYAHSQLPVLAWSPLGHGFFGGTESSDRTYRTEANLARRQRAAQLAAKLSVQPDQIALAYLFHQPFPVSAVVATRSVERMKRNLAAAEVRLTREDLHFLESA